MKKEIDPTEKLSDTFYVFIDELSKLGNIARSEKSHSNFLPEDKKSVDEAIKGYGEFVKKINESFENLKSEAKFLYNE